MPEGVRVVDEGAFAGCTALSRIGLPTTLYEIRLGAFIGCTSLSEVDCGESCRFSRIAIFENNELLIIAHAKEKK